jgi:TRAP-type C4-dicarboxylate transport system substrate-binding protein
MFVSAAMALLMALCTSAWAQSTKAGAASAASAAPKRLRIVGGLAGLNQFTFHEEPFWSRELLRLSQGRYTAEVSPFDRAGIRAQEMLSLVQTGVVPFGTLLLGIAAGSAPELAAPDLAGLNPDINTLRRTVAAFRPYLVSMLRQRYGVEVLAVYTYPAQVAFCTKPFEGLRGLAGLRVRNSSAAQADLLEALGAKPTPTAFSEILPNLRAGNIDCAITGTMSGYTVGLHELTSHLQTTALTWGLTVFVAHGASWAALPADLKALLGRELPLLEKRIWDDAERETVEGVACNVGAASCSQPKKGRMSLVVASAEDDKLRRAIFANTVLPRWLQRCGAACAEVWNQTLAPVAGVMAPQR